MLHCGSMFCFVTFDISASFAVMHLYSPTTLLLTSLANNPVKYLGVKVDSSVTGLNIASLLSENFYLYRLLFILVAVIQRLNMLQLFEI